MEYHTLPWLKQGYLWWIGYGAEVNIWLDCRLSNEPALCIYSGIATGDNSHLERRVCELISEATGDWDAKKVFSR